MKFTALSLVAIFSALPAVSAQGCNLGLQWVTNFPETGLRRYRVQLTTTPRNDAHLGIFCEELRNRVPTGNVQCFWDGGRFVADASYVEGSAGYSYVIIILLLSFFFAPNTPLADLCVWVLTMWAYRLPPSAVIELTSGLFREPPRAIKAGLDAAPLRTSSPALSKLQKAECARISRSTTY